MFEKCDSPNRQHLLLSASFPAKFELVFSLNLEKDFFFLRGSILKPSERAQTLLKNGTRDFENTPPFERSACDIQWKFLNQIFWKTKTFFKKLEYSFSVESTKIENASFPYKTAISEANVKTNRMVSTK